MTERRVSVMSSNTPRGRGDWTSSSANIDLSVPRCNWSARLLREQILSRVLRPVLDDYDVVLIDCQPSLGLLTVNAPTAAHCG